MLPRRPSERHPPMFSSAERPVCVPYKRKGKGTTPDRLIPKKVGSKSARRERVYKRAAETRRDFFRRGGARQAGGCHALPRGTELSSLCSDESTDGRGMNRNIYTVIYFAGFLFLSVCGVVQEHCHGDDYRHNGEDAEHSLSHVFKVVNKCRRVEIHMFVLLN